MFFVPTMCAMTSFRGFFVRGFFVFLFERFHRGFQLFQIGFKGADEFFNTFNVKSAWHRSF